MRGQLSQASARMEHVLTELQLQSELMREQGGTSMALLSTIESIDERVQTISVVTNRIDMIGDELKETHETVGASHKTKTQD